MRAERVGTGLYAAGLVVLCAARWTDGMLAGRIAWAGLLVAGVGYAPLLLGRGEATRIELRTIIISSTLAWVGLLLQEPLFSDDIWRYAVDASATHAGIHPLAYAPDSPKLTGIADVQRGLSNHPHMRSIYPPGAQLWFALWHWPCHAGVAGLRIGAALAAAAGAWMLRHQAPVGAGVPAWVALWAHPLVIVSVAGNGHLDALALPLMIGWSLAVMRSRLGAATALAASGVAVKLLPALLLAAQVPRHGKRAIAWAGAGAAMAGLFWLGGLGLGAKAFGSLAIYASRWTFNGSLAPLAEAAAHAAWLQVLDGDGAWFRPPGWAPGPWSAGGIWLNRWQVAGLASRGVVFASLLGTGILAQRRGMSPERAAIALMMALFLTSPVVHPWYLLWLLPLALLGAHRAALIWSLTVLLAFHTPAAALDGLPWAESLTLRCLQYVPVFGALALAGPAASRTAALTARAERP